MSSLSERNYKAAANGEWGERQAGKILSELYEKVDHINSIIDFMLNDKIPIEVKTCQIIIQTGREKYPTRTGRFTLVQDQHEYLKQHCGFYLFIVKDGRFVHSWKLIDAKQIDYRRHVQWDKLILKIKSNAPKSE